jgi:hypothetical protein
MSEEIIFSSIDYYIEGMLLDKNYNRLEKIERIESIIVYELEIYKTDLFLRETIINRIMNNIKKLDPSLLYELLVSNYKIVRDIVRKTI